MFFREKKSGKSRYLQIVENRREDGKVKQRVIGTLGRVDQLNETNQVDALLASGSRFSEMLLILNAHRQNESTVVSTRRIGSPMIFERLWDECGCKKVIKLLLGERKFEFDLERAIFLEVLHRLVSPGSDRDCYKWCQSYKIDGVDKLSTHHSYRAMAWLGEELSMDWQCDATKFSPRCTKDLIEEALFANRRDLFSSFDLVFFDTTAIYFEGEGGQTLGAYGKSKDHRPDRKQIVVGAILDNTARPVCCEIWPGNTADVSSLIPIVDRLRKRFGIGKVCIVADRGMISKDTIKKLESDTRRWQYILGARMRSVKELKRQVLTRAGRYHVVNPAKKQSKDPSPLKVKQVMIDDRRYIVCHNEQQARKDKADREAIVKTLEEQLKRGAKSLVGNKGYRKFLKLDKGDDKKAEIKNETQARVQNDKKDETKNENKNNKKRLKGFVLDRDKINEDKRYDGKWVLRTNTDYSPEDCALQYKQLLTVESLFRNVKSLFSTRPVYHRCDETIRGHVFCSFLALVLSKELKTRLEKAGNQFEWADIIRDLERIEQVEIEQDGKRFLLRTETKGCAGKVFQAIGVSLPPTIRKLEDNKSLKVKS